MYACWQKNGKALKLMNWQGCSNRTLFACYSVDCLQHRFGPILTSYTVKISQREQLNYSQQGRVWLVASRLGTGKSLSFFYSVLLVLWTLVRSIFLPVNFISEHFFHPYHLIWNRHKIRRFLIPHYEICENLNLQGTYKHQL